MSKKHTVFYRGNQQVSVDFSAEPISSDASVILLERMEKTHGLIGHFSQSIPDPRQPEKVIHSVGKLIKQRVFGLMHGYPDGNDAEHLAEDPLYRDILGGRLASQPTASRLENRMDRATIWNLCRAWVGRYIDTLEGRTELTIDIDDTDDPIHGGQQLSMFNGFYGRKVYNQLFFHDGQTGQIILPVLRPGNAHSSRWYVGILRRIVELIRTRYPDLSITIRADSGFSCPAFYRLAEACELKFVVGIAANERLKRRSERAERAIRRVYSRRGQSHQHFFSFRYQADSWEAPQRCCCKVEETGRGLNTRFIITNIPGQSARRLYKDLYVQRGEASENRIKEVKNMCYADRLSAHRFWANFFRLLLSCLAYELFLRLRQAIGRTCHSEAKRWQIATIRCRLLKIGGTIKRTKRRIYYRLSKAFAWKKLFLQLIS
ncbi:MAG: IS1380 family transposase [Balneolaceae bacterium]|nr:IS1380 family transposase [Balneolaceae bacterium]